MDNTLQGMGADAFFDAGGEMMGYNRISGAEIEYVSKVGEQAVTMIVPAKVYGQPKWNAIPMEQEELVGLGLEGEKNCYRVVIPLTKQYSKGDTPEGEDAAYSWIVYSRNNIAVLATYNDFEGGREVSYEELKGLPGFDYETDTSGERYFIIDMVTGESNEEYHTIPTKTEDGTEYYRRIEGYHFVGNKVVARYMSITKMPVTDKELLELLKNPEESSILSKDDAISEIKKKFEDRRIHPCYDWTNGETDLFRFDLEEGDDIEFYRG